MIPGSCWVENIHEVYISKTMGKLALSWAAEIRPSPRSHPVRLSSCVRLDPENPSETNSTAPLRGLLD